MPSEHINRTHIIATIRNIDRRRDYRGRYSRDDGREAMMNQLEGMMGRMGSEKDREALRRIMEQLRGA